jgi:hypothetical protein
MELELNRDAVAAAARMIGLPLGEEEIDPVLERLQVLMDAAARVEHLAGDAVDIAPRFDARWEGGET